jgi:hypothetical protein
LQQTWYFRQSVGWNPMPLDLTPRFTFALQVERLYTALLQAVHSGLSSEPGLGGKLLYAGELDGQGRALLVAGNIAGAASLAATAGQVAQKQAIRDGVADFLVTSLDEALRILKNEIRKGETVAVCVAAGPEAIEREMLERGVLPDLLAANPLGGAAFPNQGARRIEPCGRKEEQVLLRWSVASAQALWPSIALDPRTGPRPAGSASPPATWAGWRRASGFSPAHLNRQGNLSHAFNKGSSTERLASKCASA